MFTTRQLGIAALTLVVCISLLPSSLQAEEVDRELVIYQRDVAEVREVRNVSLAAGVQSIDFRGVAPTLQPGSVIIELISGKGIETQSLQYLERLVDLENWWTAQIGQKITVEAGDTSYTGILRRVTGSDLYLQETDGPALTLVSRSTAEEGLSISSLPGVLVSEPTLRWNVKADRAGKAKIRVRYLATGLTWNGEHKLNLDDSGGELVAGAVVSNMTGADLGYSKILLMAADIHLAGDQRKVDRVNPNPGASRGDKQSRFGELRQWAVEVPGTLAQESRTTYTLSSGKTSPVDRLYLYDATIYDDRIHALVETTADQAVPAGEMRIYDKIKNESWFIGSDNVDSTPPGSPLRLKLAQSFDLTADRTRMHEGSAAGMDTQQSFRVRIGNSGDAKVVVRVLERLFGDWKLNRADLNGAAVTSMEEDARTLRFDVPVDPGKTVTLNYEIRYER